MVARELACAVAVDHSGSVEPVDHEVERARIVQVDVRGAVRETRLPEPPGPGLVRERQVSVVAIRVVGTRDLRHLPDERPNQSAHPLPQRCLDGRVGHIREVVQVVGPAIDPGGDEQVLVAVVVQVGEQRGPAPIGRIDARQIADLTEAHRPLPHGAAVELQRVAGVLRMVPGREFLEVDVEAFGIGGGLEDLLLIGQHVEHREVRPPVVVEVGGVHAHRGMAGVSQRRGAGLGERTVAIIDVEEVVFLEVVGHVQVGTTVSVQVARHDPQAVARGPSVEAGALAHVHKVTPVVPIKAVADARRTRAVYDVRG